MTDNMWSCERCAVGNDQAVERCAVCGEQRPEPGVGDWIEGFELIEPLGEGGFGKVWKAYDRELDRFVAIKILHARVDDDAGDDHRFMTEGRLMARVAPDFAVAVVRPLTYRGRPCLVMEYAAGGNVEARLRRALGEDSDERRLLELADLRFLIGGIGRSLAAAHRAGIVHRDVKPPNLLLRQPSTYQPPESGRVFSDTEVVLLADLGQARLVDSIRSDSLTAVGTVGWSAPEQWLTSTPLTVAADIFAASKVVLWAASGESPQPSARSITSVAIPTSMVDRLGESFARALQRGMEFQPTDRQPNAQTWCQELLYALPQAARRGREVPMSRRAVIIGSGAVALGAAAALASPISNLFGDNLVIYGPDQVSVDETAAFVAGQDQQVVEWTINGQTETAAVGTVTPVTLGEIEIVAAGTNSAASKRVEVIPTPRFPIVGEATVAIDEIAVFTIDLGENTDDAEVRWTSSADEKIVTGSGFTVRPSSLGPIIITAQVRHDGSTSETVRTVIAVNG